jgi:preprotein translocase subunit SecG
MKTIIIYTTIFFLALVTLAIGYTHESDAKRGCVASAYQAETRGFNLQENLDACNNL